MSRSLYKCCICLNTVVEPIIMCHQTHIGCFDCVSTQIQKTTSRENTCAICRQPIRVRFDRLIQETAACFHRSKKRKKDIRKFQVFNELLELNNKEKYRSFNKIFIKFSKSIDNQEKLEQIHKDIMAIQQAKLASKRLIEINLLQRRNMSI